MPYKVTAAPFNIEVLAGGRPRVSRQIIFANGNTISFDISLDEDKSATLGDLHHRSVAEVIKHLQDFAPQKPQ